MAFYLMRFSYTPETWSKLMENPEDRRDAARAYIEQVGGRPTRLLVWLRPIRRLRALRGARQRLGGRRRACYHGRRRPSLGRDNGADDRGRDAGGTREGQGDWLPAPRRVASDLRVSFANGESGATPLPLFTENPRRVR